MSSNGINTHVFTWRDYQATITAGRTLSGRAFLEALRDGTLPMPPFVSLLGLCLIAVDDRSVTVTMEPKDFMHNGIGLLHGGITASLCDATIGCASLTVVRDEQVAVTSDLAVRYFKPLTMKSGTVRCEGSIINAGRTQITAEARMYDASGRLCSHATSTLSLVDASRMR